jgi:hypothetical protein
VWEFPEEITIAHHEASFSGTCPKCGGKAAKKR